MHENYYRAQPSTPTFLHPVVATPLLLHCEHNHKPRSMNFELKSIDNLLRSTYKKLKINSNYFNRLRFSTFFVSTLASLDLAASKREERAVKASDNRCLVKEKGKWKKGVEV